MILFSAKKSAVHEMHLDAIEDYAAENSLGVSQRLFGFGAIKGLIGTKERIIFSQSTGLSSAVVLPLARILGKTVVHYMHEPTPLRQKLKENPVVKSLVWHTVQWFEVVSASKVMVSRQFLLDQAAKIYRVPKTKFILAPLLMPTAALPEPNKKPLRITYLGRVDERRYFSEFLAQAPALAERGYQPTILTGDTVTLETHAGEIPVDVDVVAETNFPEILKERIMGETLVLWNPKHGSIAQSGVTADAVRYGLSILLTDRDPSFYSLLEKGIALDFYDAKSKSFEPIDHIESEVVRVAAQTIFSQSHGADAFRETYLPNLASS